MGLLYSKKKQMHGGGVQKSRSKHVKTDQGGDTNI